MSSDGKAKGAAPKGGQAKGSKGKGETHAGVARRAAENDARAKRQQRLNEEAMVPVGLPDTPDNRTRATQALGQVLGLLPQLSPYGLSVVAASVKQQVLPAGFSVMLARQEAMPEKKSSKKEKGSKANAPAISKLPKEDQELVNRHPVLSELTAEIAEIYEGVDARKKKLLRTATCVEDLEELGDTAEAFFREKVNPRAILLGKADAARDFLASNVSSLRDGSVLSADQLAALEKAIKAARPRWPRKPQQKPKATEGADAPMADDEDSKKSTSDAEPVGAKSSKKGKASASGGRGRSRSPRRDEFESPAVVLSPSVEEKIRKDAQAAAAALAPKP